MFDCILFDLDGTLTDPFEGITNSIVYALDKFGIKITDRRTLTDFIGPPLNEAFKTRFGFDDEKALQTVKYFREYYKDYGLYENYVYKEIPPVLEELKRRGKILIVATSKVEEFSVRVLKHFDLIKYFNYVCGATKDFTRVKKADVIAHALKTAEITQKNRVLMVGDRNHDVFGAKANGIKSCGVLYGYGDRRELETAGADYIVTSPDELLSIV